MTVHLNNPHSQQRIRWGLIGVGDIANKRVASAIQADPNSELVAVCRRSEKELNHFADQFAVAERFTDADELLRMSNLDAVYIATPVDCHCPQTIAAAAAGKHVLVEKPMALNPIECEQMIAACDQAKVVLGVAYYRRFYPAIARTEQIVRSGQLGKILSISCVTGNPNRFPADDWRVVRSRGGGGPLMDIGSHRIDVFIQLMGEIDSVKAQVIDCEEYESEQVATLLLQFKRGMSGVLQCYFGTVNTPDRFEVIGTNGRVTVEDLNADHLDWYHDGGVTRESHPPSDNLHSPLINDFSLSLIHGHDPMIPGPIGMQTNEVIEMAYRDAN